MINKGIWFQVQKLNDGSYEFTCQHGPKECHANKYHSCAIALETVAQSLEYIYCSMSADDPSSDEVLEEVKVQTRVF